MREIGDIVEELCCGSGSNSHETAVASRAELDRVLAGCRVDVDRLAELRNQRPGSAVGSEGSWSSRDEYDPTWRMGSHDRDFCGVRPVREEGGSSRGTGSRGEGSDRGGGGEGRAYEDRIREYYAAMEQSVEHDEGCWTDTSADEAEGSRRT